VETVALSGDNDGPLLVLLEQALKNEVIATMARTTAVLANSLLTLVFIVRINNYEIACITWG
jgi:hypothetical protein